jgi:hypothetical protein
LVDDSPDCAPRHIEAWMRLGRGTLDAVSEAEFAVEARIARRCIKDERRRCERAARASARIAAAVTPQQLCADAIGRAASPTIASSQQDHDRALSRNHPVQSCQQTGLRSGSPQRHQTHRAFGATIAVLADQTQS